MSSNSNNLEFSRKKEHLLNVLKYFTSSLLFPPQIFNVLERIDPTGNYVIGLCYFIREYNDTLIKLRSLELELIELKKFGAVSNNSEFIWNSSIKWNIGKCVNLRKAILESCDAKGPGQISTFKRCNIDRKKINIFMMICKENNNKYTITYKNKNIEGTFSIESVKEIIALLPVYSQFSIANSKYVIISVKELDESNKLQPSLLTKKEAKILDNFSPVLNSSSSTILNGNSSPVLNGNPSKILNANSSVVSNSNSKPKAGRSLSITSENSNNNIFFNALNTHPNYGENSSVVSNSNSKPKANKSKNSRPIVKINSSLWYK